MMRSIIRSSLSFRFLVVIVALAVMITGVLQLREMPIDVLPEFSPPFVEIQTEALGLSAEEVEQLITVPMEQSLLNGVAWLDTIRSESVPGLSSIRIYFEPGTDLYQARQMVAERLTQAYSLPPVSKPPVMIQPLSSTSRFMIVGLSSQELSLIELSVLARWTITPRLLGVPGVANVAIWGQRERQLQVQIDPERMQAQGITLQQVLRTTGNSLWVSPLSFIQASTPGTGGFIDTPNQRLGIWHVLPITTPEDLSKVPVEGASSILLGDVATVVEDHQLMVGDAVINDSPSLLLVINKAPGANILDVTRDVEAAFADLQPGLGGVEVDSQLFRPASFVEMAMSNLGNSLLISALLIIIVLFVFLYDWRLVLIGVIVIPLSLIAAGLVLHLRGETLNMLTIAGLVVAVSMIIDDVIIDMENIARRMRENRVRTYQRSVASTILDASSEMRNTVFFASLILVLAVLPLFFLNGTSAAFLRPLALSYVLALFASMLVALVVTPALSMIFLSDISFEQRPSPVRPWLQRTYERGLNRFVNAPHLALIVVSVLLVVGLLAVPFLKSDRLLPSFTEPNILIQLDGPSGTSRLEMDRVVARVTTELRAIAGVRNVGAHIGRATFADQTSAINSAEIWVTLDPTADYDATVSTVQNTINGYPGLSSEVTTYLQRTLAEAIPGTGEDMVVRVFGEDLSTLETQTVTVKDAIAGVDGVVDLEVNNPVAEATLEIKVDLERAQAYGIKPGDVRRTAAVVFSGIRVGSLFEDQKVFDVLVTSIPAARQNLDNINAMLIDTPSGGHVRLEDVADVSIVSAPQVIRRQDVSPYLDITFNVEGRDLGAVTADIERTLGTVAFPLEYHAEILGVNPAVAASSQRVWVAIIITLAGILLLLQASFHSWRLALVSLLTVPASLAGAVLVAYLVNGGALTLGSALGMLAVLGIAIRSSVMLISRYERLEQEGEIFGNRLIVRGANEQTAPVLMTALITGLVFVPFILSGNVAGHEVLRPMAFVILGGLVTTTLINLFVLPVLYLRFGEASREADLGLLPAAADD